MEAVTIRSVLRPSARQAVDVQNICLFGLDGNTAFVEGVAELVEPEHYLSRRWFDYRAPFATMLEHYSHIRHNAKKAALDCLERILEVLSANGQAVRVARWPTGGSIFGARSAAESAKPGRTGEGKAGQLSWLEARYTFCSGLDPIGVKREFPSNS